jgi:hypothetical protein
MTGALAERLAETWQRQAEDGFLLSHPDTARIEERIVRDDAAEVDYRFRWMPHREIRFDLAELERRGILNPDRDEAELFRDDRDPSGRHCFLCVANIAVCNPMEELVPVRLAGRDYVAGANFAWIERNHFTVMSAEHIDQDFTPHVVAAMVELHRLTDGRFRVLYNGAQAGATIPWHLHYQITTERLPVEALPEGREEMYPALLSRIRSEDGDVGSAYDVASAWIERDPEHHRINMLVAGSPDQPVVFVFARDTRLTHAAVKGLMGGFEVCGDLVYSEPDKREVFENATAGVAREALLEIRPNVDRPAQPTSSPDSAGRGGDEAPADEALPTV